MLLRQGSSGPEVKILQAALLAAGFDPDGDDGIFGPDTKTAVTRFQHAHGLTVDGLVDWPNGETARALDAKPHAAVDTPIDTAATRIGAPSVPDDAVTLAMNSEGFSATPYWDPDGKVWTYGFGSTRDFNGNPVTRFTPPITRVQGVTLMRRDLTSAAGEVARDVHIALTEHERAALDDFVYNVGAGNFRGSTLLRKLNAGDRVGAANEFEKWDHAGGRVLAGLLRRRLAERDEFLKA
jgi:lysozyme